MMEPHDEHDDKEEHVGKDDDDMKFSMARRQQDFHSHWPIWLYIPNLIGYARIILCAYALRYHDDAPRFLGYYGLSFLLDGADGLAARQLQQTSRAGALLDMVTDRCGTAALLTLLAHSYPQASPLCLALIFLDGYSHWMQMVAGAVAGKQSHKAASRGALLTLYYWRPVLTVVCLLNETALLAMYMVAEQWYGPLLCHIGSHPIFMVHAVIAVCVPTAILKQIVSLFQIVSAHDTICDSLNPTTPCSSASASASTFASADVQQGDER